MDSIQNIAKLFAEQFPEYASDPRVIAFFEKHSDTEEKTNNHTDPKDVVLSFGKYKSFKPYEIIKTDAGRKYLEWLMSQTFFEESKFPEVYNCLVFLGLDKKKHRNNVAARVMRPGD